MTRFLRAVMAGLVPASNRPATNLLQFGDTMIGMRWLLIFILLSNNAVAQPAINIETNQGAVGSVAEALALADPFKECLKAEIAKGGPTTRQEAEALLQRACLDVGQAAKEQIVKFYGGHSALKSEPMKTRSVEMIVGLALTRAYREAINSVEPR